MKVTLTFKKSTKGTHVYEDTDEGTAIPTLYIKKDPLAKAFPEKIPMGIVVTIEEVK